MVEITRKIKVEDPNIVNAKYIPSPYPGSFCFKTYDNGKIKVFKRGDKRKIYVYPAFKPISHNRVLRLKLSFEAERVNV